MIKDKNNPNWIVLEAVIPPTDGGFMVREVGLFDDVGDMIAIGKCPEAHKPVIESGSAKDLYIRMILEVSNTAVVNLKVDPAIILATRKDMDTLSNRITKNETDMSELRQEADEHKADYATFQEQIKKELSNYNSYSSHKDENGIFTVVEYKRADATLYMKSTLSNPDTEGNYQTMTWEFYDTDGTEVINTVVWSIVYDEDGDIVSKVVSA